MVRKNKLIASLLLTMSVICIGLFPANVKASEQQVFDDAYIFDSSDITRIENCINDVESVTGWDIMAVTTNGTGSKSVTAYSDDYFEAHSDAYSGVACLMDMNSRTLHISTFGEAITYLTDARLDDILDYAYDNGNGDYADIMYYMVSEIETMYYKGDPTTGDYTSTDKGGLEFFDVIISIFATIIVTGLVPIIIIGKYKMNWGLPRYSVKKNSKLNLRDNRDTLIDSKTTSRRIQSSSSSSSSGSRSSSSRSSTHRTSSGRTAGGRSRSF